MAEMRGDKRVSVVYQSFSKAKGERVTKFKKGPASEQWKKEIVRSAIDFKQQHGSGHPKDENHEEIDYDENLEIVIDKLEDLFHFDSDDDNE